MGSGNVGATAAYALLLDGAATDITLIDLAREKAEGIMLDLEHSLPFTSAVKLEASNEMSAAAGSHLIVVTAGKRQAEGETRLDLARANAKIFQEMIPKLAKAAPNAIFLIVTNPVDVLTYVSLKASGFPWQRVFGSGTVLDSARLQFHISEKLQIHPRSIDAYVLGEHGDTSFPVWSSANIMGKPLLEFEKFGKKEADDCYDKTKNAAYRIIHDVGYTCYSIGTVIRDLVRAIASDSHQVFTLSTLLQNDYGEKDVCLSMPCVLGRRGIVQHINIPLDAEEKKRLKKSADAMRAII